MEISVIKLVLYHYTRTTMEIRLSKSLSVLLYQDHYGNKGYQTCLVSLYKK